MYCLIKKLPNINTMTKSPLLLKCYVFQDILEMIRILLPILLFYLTKTTFTNVVAFTIVKSNTYTANHHLYHKSLLQRQDVTTTTTVQNQLLSKMRQTRSTSTTTTTSHSLLPSTFIPKLQLLSLYSSTNDIDAIQLQKEQQNTNTNNGIYTIDDITISISDQFDSGNIEVVDVIRNNNNNNNDDNSKDTIDFIVLLNIKKDIYTELEQIYHFQYFAFRSIVSSSVTSLLSPKSITVQYKIINAGIASYPRGFIEYTVFYTNYFDDSNSWKRLYDNTQFELIKNTDTNSRLKYSGGSLSWTYTHTIQSPYTSSLSLPSSDTSNTDNNNSNIVHFAYFPPYTYSRHLRLIEICTSRTSVISLGKSIDQHDIECIIIGTGSTIVWIIHRQHPGEHMAEYYAEGLLYRLLGLNTNNNNNNSSENENDDIAVQKLLQLYTFYIVPNMCPDGAIRGHLRTNAIGANLNREWCTTKTYNKNNNNKEGKQDEQEEELYEAPTIQRSPEVYYVLNKMIQTGCDLFLDIHGDEALPYNFFAQPAVPNFDERLQCLHGAFLAEYCRTNTDIQQQYGYPVMSQPSTIFNTACKQVCYRFNCLSITLEMPFKDCYSNPEPVRGWSPERSRQLGSSLINPLLYIHPYLRNVNGTTLQSILPKHDAYIRPTPAYPMKSQIQ